MVAGAVRRGDGVRGRVGASAVDGTRRGQGERGWTVGRCARRSGQAAVACGAGRAGGAGRVEQVARGAGPGARQRRKKERQEREGEGKEKERKEKRKWKKEKKRKKEGERKRKKREREREIRAGITALIAEPVGHAWRPGARERDARVEEK